MAEKEIDEAKKLSPEERIRKLRELTKKDEEEIELARKLIKESETELEEESRKKRFPIPELREVDVTRLFEKELEERVALERPRRISQEEARRQYELAQEIRYSPLRELRSSWEELRNDVYASIQENGAVTEQQMGKLDAIMYATQAKIRDGSYVRDARDIHEAARRLMERYKG